MKLASFLKINDWLSCSLSCHNVMLSTFPDPSGRQETSEKKTFNQSHTSFPHDLSLLLIYYGLVLQKSPAETTALDQAQIGRAGTSAGGSHQGSLIFTWYCLLKLFSSWSTSKSNSHGGIRKCCLFFITILCLNVHLEDEVICILFVYLKSG